LWQKNERSGSNPRIKQKEQRDFFRSLRMTVAYTRSNMARLSYLPAEQQNTSSPTDAAEATCSLENIMRYEVHQLYKHYVTHRVNNVTEEKSLVGLFVFLSSPVPTLGSWVRGFEFHLTQRRLLAFVLRLCSFVCS
jgi:hypothetical protein